MLHWSPEGKRLLYRYRPPGQQQSHLVWQPTAGGELEDLPVDGTPTDWWGDGETEYLLLHSSKYGIKYGRAAAGGDFEFTLFREKVFGAQLSHDGRFIYYGTGGSDHRIEVRSFPDGGGPWQASRPGERADNPRWSPSGNELFYAVGDQLIAAEYTTDQGFVVTKRTNLFRSENFLISRGGHYDVAAGGERFVLLEALDEDKSALRVTQNWFAEFSGEH